MSGTGVSGAYDAMRYFRTFRVPEEWNGSRIILHFGAVDQCCTVWVNGQEAGSHTGGYLPFALDVTELIEGDAFTLELRVTDPTDTGSLSRGKQRLKNTGIWYTPQSGIWQTVWMECVPENYLRSLRITPKPEENAVHIRLEADDPAMAAVTICRDGGIIAEGQTDENGESTLTIPAEELRLWSPENPFLYDAAITLAGGDKVESYFGMRAFGIGKDEKGLPRLLLNGKPYFQNGLLDQGYWPQGLYTPPSDAAVERELSEVKALGFNLLRKHAKIEPQRWYYHCDRLGLVVWQDMVNGGSRYNLWFVTYLTNVLQPLVRRLPDAEPLWGLLSRGKASSRETYRKELQATVEALRCHPCIGCWVPFNEGWGQFDAAGAVQAIRTLDDTRLVDEASGWYDQGGGDVCSIHNYFYPLHVKPGSRTVALSEYGGIAWPMPGHEAPGKTYGYGTAKSRADLTARCKKLQLGTVLPQLKKGLSALVYTQLTDVEDEVNGLFTYDRAEIKPDANAVRSVNAALAAEFAKVTR